MNTIESIKGYLCSNLNTVKTILILMYLAGFLGMQYGISRPYFLYLTPLNLLISTIILLLFHENWHRKAAFILVFITIAGFVIEVIGVSTGKIFGTYQYGPTLGMKLFAVPISIGLNWLLLTYLFCHFVKYFLAKKIKNILVLVIISGLLMTFFDFIIEPVAIYFDFWKWQSTDIPVQNYVAWFIVSCIFATLMFFYKIVTENKIASLLLSLQLLFFLLHFIVLRTNS